MFAVKLFFFSSTYSQNKLNVPLIMEGACPFECCTYTTLTTFDDIKVYQNPQDTTLFVLITKGEEFKAKTGNVYITETGLVVAKKSFVIPDITPIWEVEKNDTLYILDYQGEGYYNVFFRGKYSNVSDHFWYNRRINKPNNTDLAKQLRAAETEWWIKIVDSNSREGWIYMKQARVFGHEACG
jgi:hypothetical protein